MLDHLPDIVITIDRKGIVLSLNRWITSGSVRDLLNTPIYEALDPTQVPSIKARIEQAFASGKADRFQMPAMEPDGTNTVLLDVRIVPVVSNEDRVKTAILLAQHTSQDEDPEPITVEGEPYNQSLIDSFPGLFYLFDSNGKMVQWNKAVSLILGYSDEEIANMDALEFCVPEQRALVTSTIKDVLDGNVRTIQAELLAKSGRRIPLIESGTRVDFDGKPCIAGLAIDMSSLTEARARLREAQNQYQVLVDTARVIICVVDADGKFNFANAYAGEGLGLDPDEIIGKSMWDLFPKTVADRQMGDIRKVITTGEPFSSLDKTSVQGVMRWYSTRIQQLPAVHGKSTQALVVTRDVHDEIMTRNELQRQLQCQSVLSSFSQSILASKDSLEQVVRVGLQHLSTLPDIDRSALFENYSDTSGRLCARVSCEVSSGSSDSAVSEDAFSFQNLTYEDGLERWETMMAEGKMIYGAPSLFPYSEKAILEQLKIEFFLAVPLFVHGKWYGFIALYRCDATRPWSEHELHAFTTAAGILGERLTNLKMYGDLRESEERYRTVVESSPYGIILADVETREFKYVNPQICKMTGFASSTMLKMRVDDLHPPELLDHVLRSFHDSVSGNIDVVRSMPVLRSDGSWFYVDINAVSVVVDGDKMVLGFLCDVTRQKEQHETLTQQRTRFRFLSKRLMEMQEDDRKLVAHELHDTVIQGLAAAQLHLENALHECTESERQHFENVSSVLAQSISELRSIISGLRPPMLEATGLVATVRWYMSSLTSNIRLSFEVKGDESPLDELLTTNLFRITQELVMNALKHSQAESLSVVIDFQSERILTLVIDDGIGFDWAQVRADWTRKSNLGLLSVSERTESMNGELRVETQPGKGTRIEVAVPRS